jgi:hypothetical protein
MPSLSVRPGQRLSRSLSQVLRHTLDLGFDIIDGVRRLHLEGDSLPREGLHEDLHLAYGDTRQYRARGRVQLSERCSPTQELRSSAKLQTATGQKRIQKKRIRGETHILHRCSITNRHFWNFEIVSSVCAERRLEIT